MARNKDQYPKIACLETITQKNGFTRPETLRIRKEIREIYDSGTCSFVRDEPNIFRAFSWWSTPQDHDYWGAIANRLWIVTKGQLGLPAKKEPQE